MTSTALRSRAWKLLEMVTTPLLPSDYLDLVSPLRAGADLRGLIPSVRPACAAGSWTPGRRDHRQGLPLRGRGH
ncbi:ferredoxin reductase, partial [Streptomyces sp. NPDC002920]